MIRIRLSQTRDAEDIRRIGFDTALLASLWLRIVPTDSLSRMRSSATTSGVNRNGCMSWRRMAGSSVIWRARWIPAASAVAAGPDSRGVCCAMGGLRGRWRRRQSLQIGLAVLRYAWIVMRCGVRGHAAYPAEGHLKVDREHRGQGVGGVLLRAFLHDAAVRGVPGVYVSTASADGQRFFARMGFTLAVSVMAPSIAGKPLRPVGLDDQSVDGGR